MSVKMTSLVWELSFNVASHKLVMLALADNSDSEGLCYPFVERIARYSGLKVRQVQNIIKQLEKDQYLTRDERYKRNRQQSSNCYQLHFLDHHPRVTHSSTETHCSTKKISTGVHPSAPMGASQCTPPPALECTPPPQKNDEKFNGNNIVINNAVSVTKSSLTNNITKRERALSVFEPDEESKILCADLKLSLKDEMDSFMNRYKGEKTQYEFQRWLKNSYNYINRKKPVQNMETNVSHSYSSMRDFTQERLDREAMELTGRSNSHGSEAPRDNARRNGMQKAEGYLFQGNGMA